MLRMIIADDEPLVRETISRIIDWNSNGIQLLGTCRDGIETYNMILDEYPDIVLLHSAHCNMEYTNICLSPATGNRF